ncbi:MAG TPA: MFS transporter [Stellaceae bacterium]|nr:MFS transporter [Stellaceae bacterium]
MSNAAPDGRQRSSAFRESLKLLGARRFGTFCFASLLSNMGTWAQQVAEPWLLLAIGASPFILGLDSFAGGAPVFLLTLVGGILADRRDRRHIITIFQSIQALCPATLIVLLVTGAVRPWMVIVLSLIVGITDAISMPSFQSIVPSIVERRQISAALALTSTQFNISRILGPAVAGAVMTAVGAVGCFALNTLSYIPFIAVALWILPRRGPVVAARDRSGRRRLLAGVRFAARDPMLRGALATVLVSSVLCGPLVTFSPLLVKEVFRRDVSSFSIAITSFGIGGLVGAVVLLGIDAARDRRPIGSHFAAAYAVSLMLIALDPWFWALPLLLILAGFAMTASNTSANTLLQAMAPDRFRGQTVSLYMLAMRGGISSGALLTGASIHLLGVRPALFINGLLAAVLQLIVGRRWLSPTTTLPDRTQPAAIS